MAGRERPGAGAAEKDANHDAASTPRWVKVFGIVAFVVLAVFVILLVTGRGGDHGPARHASSGDAETAASIRAAASPVTDDSLRP